MIPPHHRSGNTPAVPQASEWCYIDAECTRRHSIPVFARSTNHANDTQNQVTRPTTYDSASVGERVRRSAERDHGKKTPGGSAAYGRQTKRRVAVSVGVRTRERTNSMHHNQKRKAHSVYQLIMHTPHPTPERRRR